MTDILIRQALDQIFSTHSQEALIKVNGPPGRILNVRGNRKIEQVIRAVAMLAEEHPLTADKYATIKKRLTSTFCLLRQERTQALLNVGELGDRKSPELMDEMLAFLGNEPMNFLFEGIFLSRMPASIRQCLSGEDSFADPRKAADQADAIWTTLKCKSLADTKLDINAVRPTPSPRRKTTPTHCTIKEHKSDVCWYHVQFSADANSCKSGCKFFPALNVLADALSRIGALLDTVSPQSLAQAQAADPELAKVRTSLTALKGEGTPVMQIVAESECKNSIKPAFALLQRLAPDAVPNVKVLITDLAPGFFNAWMELPSYNQRLRDEQKEEDG
ncbi:hypothetical protein TCAL_17104 [Tigriopus californicus]|uniref:Uncharacterized protein n=1 Tax=Tigriopus californicus TaxID=6832 RepID=A0A553P363_TIGCA|nr:hypothetical protein TCAL_17104 [Tigriopus californicus]